MEHERGGPPAEEHEKQEQYTELGRLTLLRHGETEYTDVYPDLTKEGEATIQQSAEQIAKGLHDAEEVTLISSDTPRALGSADIIKKRIGYARDVQKRHSIRSMDQRDPEKVQQVIHEIIDRAKAEEHSTEPPARAVDRAYLLDDRFNDASIFEPRTETEKRFFQNLEHTVRAFDVIRKHPELAKPHLIAVSHQELLTHLTEQAFHLEARGEEPLKNGELIEVRILQPSDDSHEYVDLEVSLRGEHKRVRFDRRTRTLFVPA